MMRIHLILCWVVTLLIRLANGGVTFDCGNNDEQCLGQPVEYQCTVTGSPTNILTWRVYTDNGTQIGSSHNYLSSNIGTSVSIGGVFTVEQLSPPSPLISNISFTVQSSINGYTIICVDGNTMDNETCVVNVQGPFPPPSVDPISVDSSINIVWTPPNITSQCVVSSYSITSNATNNSIITTTDTSVDIPLAGLYPGVYCVSVATVDTANRTGEYSNEECVELAVSAAPIVTWSFDTNNLTIFWTFPQPIVPPLLYVYIYYTTSPDGPSQLIPLLPNVTNYTIPLITNTTYYYNISVYGHNILGNGSIANIGIDMSTTPSPSVTTPPVTSVSTSPTKAPNDSNGSITIFIVVPVVVLVSLILIILITIFCLCLCYSERYRQQSYRVSNRNTTQTQVNECYECANRERCPTGIVNPNSKDERYNHLDYALKDFSGKKFEIIFPYSSYEKDEPVYNECKPDHDNMEDTEYMYDNLDYQKS